MGREPLLHYEVHGRTGPPILLVHGMLSSRAQWGPNLQALCALGRPVVVELFGHGRSPSPDAPECYTPEAYCAEFESIRRALGAERWFVIGQSLGAALTLRYALEHPDRVIAQAFTNSNSALGEPTSQQGSRPALEAFLERLESEGGAALERMSIHPKHSRLPAEIKSSLVADAGLHSPRGVGLTVVHTALGASVRERIHENARPTLLLVGRREKRFAPHREYAEKQMPRLEVVPLDAGHAVNIEAAPAFNKAVGTFFSRHR